MPREGEQPNDGLDARFYRTSDFEGRFSREVFRKGSLR